MAYLGSLFKHKWIFIALSMMVAIFASFHSVKLFVWSFLIVCWLLYLRASKLVIVVCVLLTACMYMYSETRQVEQQMMALPSVVKWTDSYKMNGDRLRGFVKTEDGTKYYVSYKVTSAAEKQALTEKALAGRAFQVVQAELNNQFKLAHEYSFSMATYLKSHEAIGTVEIKEWHEVESENTWLDALYQYRFQVNTLIEQHFPANLVAEAQALLFGEQDLVDADATRAYQKLGITHLFAISGLHIALVSLLFFQGFIRIGVRREIATIILLIVLPIYGVLAGGAPSVWRAVFVVIIVLLFRYINVRIAIDDALAICFIGFLLVQPGVVYQVGFQLSFLATVALVYSTPILEKVETWWAQSLVMSFICQLLVYPILLYHFFEISLSSFFANMLFVPLFSFVILPINFLLLLLTFISPFIANIAFSVYEPARAFLQSLILVLQDIPYQMWVAGRPSSVWLIVLYVSVFASFYLLMKQQYKKVVGIILLPALLFHFQPMLESDFKISFIDVGQGDSILIEYPRQQKVVLIDTGGLLRFDIEDWQRRRTEYEIGRQVVVPFLKGKGIAEVDVLVITHADADHVEGAEEVLREIRVKEVHITPNSSNEKVLGDFWEEVQKQRIQVYEKMAGHSIDNHLAYLWPKETDYEGNNDSLVLRFQYGALTMLFTGDLEEAGELQLVHDDAPLIAQMTVLKAGHHGSKTSSSETFIDKVAPKFVVFTAGYENRFGHPHPSVVERLEERNITYFITGEQGTIEIKTDGTTMRFATMH